MKWLLVLLILIPTALAQTYSFHLVDTSTGETLTGITAYINNTEYTIEEYLTVSDEMDGRRIIVKTGDTPDFLGVINLSESQISLVPAGFIVGMVVRKGERIPDALVRVECSDGAQSMKTDESGRFRGAFPVGDCRIVSSNQGYLGQVSLNLQGPREVTIELDTRISSRPYEKLWIVLAIPFFFVILYLVFRPARR